MGPMQCQTVKAIMISIAAQEVRRPLRTFVLLSLVWILQFCSLSLFGAACIFVLVSWPKLPGEKEDGRRRKRGGEARKVPPT